jgi:hypothetical protein
MSWQTFLSYSRQQYYSAEMLALHLQKLGISVWFDVQQLEPGTNWQTDILDGLNNADSVLLVASRAALASQYVEREWRSALEQNRPVIVALVERVRLPRDLRRTPVIDCRANFETSIEKLHNVILDPQTPTARVWQIPRLPDGVRKTMYAFLIHDLRTIGIIVISVLMWLLLFQDTSVPGRLLDLLLAELDKFDRTWADTLLTWLAPVGVFIIFMRFTRSIGELKFHRFIRRDLRVLTEKPKQNETSIIFPILLWMALASGYLSIFSDVDRNNYPAISTVRLTTLAGVIVTLWLAGRLFPRMFPKLPNPDILRWLKPGEAPDIWRVRLYQEYLPPAKRYSDKKAIALHAIVEPNDLPVLETIQPIIEKNHGKIVPKESPADYNLLILSHAMSRKRVAEALSDHEKHLLAVIASRFSIPRELEALSGFQFVDFSNKDSRSLEAELQLLTAESDSDRSRMQPHLNPVNLKRIPVPMALQKIATSVFALALLCFLVVSLNFWQSRTQSISIPVIAGLLVTALVLSVNTLQIDRAIRPFPRPLMIFLGFWALAVLLIGLSDLSIEITLRGQTFSFYPYGLVILGGVALLTTAQFLSLIIKNPYIFGAQDRLGMPAMHVPVLQALIWLAGCMVFCLIVLLALLPK